MRRNRQFQGAALGCVVGGGLAGGVQLLRGDTEKAVRDAAIGCAAGGVAGFAYGSYVDARSQTYANEQERVDGLTTAATEDVARYKKLNGATERLIKEERKRLAKLDTAKHNTTQQVADREKMVAGREETLRLLSTQVEEIEGNVKAIEHDRSSLASLGADTAGLEAQKKAMIAQRKKLSRKIIILAAAG